MIKNKKVKSKKKARLNRKTRARKELNLMES